MNWNKTMPERRKQIQNKSFCYLKALNQPKKRRKHDKSENKVFFINLPITQHFFHVYSDDNWS